MNPKVLSTLASLLGMAQSTENLQPIVKHSRRKPRNSHLFNARMKAIREDGAGSRRIARNFVRLDIQDDKKSARKFDRRTDPDRHKKFGNSGTRYQADIRLLTV